MSYDFHARYGLITYSQCGALDPWAVSNHFSDLEAECIVAREMHDDGGTHLHVFIDFGRKRRFRITGQWDVGGHHPNIVQSRGTPERGYDYVCKEGDVVAGGLQRPAGSGSGLGGSDALWHQAMDCEDRESFLEFLRLNLPKSLIISFSQVTRFADWRYRPPECDYIGPEVQYDFTGIDGLLQWSQRYVTAREGSTPRAVGESK